MTQTAQSQNIIVVSGLWISDSQKSICTWKLSWFKCWRITGWLPYLNSILLRTRSWRKCYQLVGRSRLESSSVLVFVKAFIGVGSVLLENIYMVLFNLLPVWAQWKLFIYLFCYKFQKNSFVSMAIRSLQFVILKQTFDIIVACYL